MARNRSSIKQPSKKSKKLRVAILFGGRSAEHEVSVVSAKNIIGALDKKKYEVVPIGIDKKGSWHLLGNQKSLTDGTKYSQIVSAKTASLEPTTATSSQKIDVIFPVLHGTFGEDGTVQGLIKLANLPFVGAGVLGSAIGMDKDVQKRILRDAKIPVAPFLVFNSADKINYDAVISKLHLPLFVKPANLGSSVGIAKVRNKSQLVAAVKDAFRYDRKILVEKNISGRELEISVLGNEHPITSVPGEVITNKAHAFYSYEAKYLDENGATLVVPAKLTKQQTTKIQKTAIAAYRALCCEGMARVDMFLDRNNRAYINEINTIPGFTSISMYPKLWEASGLSQTKLLDKLIQLAIDRFKKEQRLKLSR